MNCAVLAIGKVWYMLHVPVSIYDQILICVVVFCGLDLVVHVYEMELSFTSKI